MEIARKYKKKLAVSIFWKLKVEKQQSEIKFRKTKVGINDSSPFRLEYMMNINRQDI